MGNAPGNMVQFDRTAQFLFLSSSFSLAADNQAKPNTTA